MAFQTTGTVPIDNALNTAAGCCCSREALTVESAGFSGRQPKAITLFLCSMDGYFEVEGGNIKTRQAVVFGVAIVLNEECLCMCVRASEGVV